MERIPRISVSGGTQIPIIQRIPAPVTDVVAPPIVRGIDTPIVNIPDIIIPYPTIDIPTRQEWRQQMTPVPVQQPTSPPPEDTRALPPPKPQPQTPVKPQPIKEVVPPEQKPDFTIGGVDINVPEATILVSAAATAIVVTAASLGATFGFNALKRVVVAKLKKNKVKIKGGKSVLHYIPTSDGEGVKILRYSSDGVSLVDTTSNVEDYIRNQIDQNVLYELDNTVIIDSSLQTKFTKEGSDRFKLLFLDPQKFVKKLTAKVSL